MTKTSDSLVVGGTSASLLAREKGHDRYAVSTIEAGTYAEYVVPHDAFLDATVIQYSVTASPDRGTWPLRGRGVCVVEGGYADVLRRYMAGASVGDVAKELELGEDEARSRIGTALSRLRCRLLGGC